VASPNDTGAISGPLGILLYAPTGQVVAAHGRLVAEQPLGAEEMRRNLVKRWIEGAAQIAALIAAGALVGLVLVKISAA
jgi:hypothetical protein